MASKKKTAKNQKPKGRKAIKKVSRRTTTKPSHRRAAKASSKVGAKAAKGAASKPVPAYRHNRKSSWLDENSHKPLIERYARQLRSFMNAMADGRIDESELRDQEQRLGGLMKEVEPQLDDRLHAKVTELLCELTAYDLMHMLYSINANRPRTTFQG